MPARSLRSRPHDRKPVRILDARGHYWCFDPEGRIDEDLRQQLAEHMDLLGTAPRKQGRVVDLVPEIKKRELQDRYQWTMTADDLDRIATDLWPGINGPAAEVAAVKGKAPRKPPLSHDARWALQRMRDHVAAISHELAGLSERALKGLAFEALRMADFDDEALYRGVAAQAQRQEAIRDAYRTGKGEWIAIVEATRRDPNDPHVLAHVAEVSERCPNRAAAVEAGRRLMAEKAVWLGEGTFVEARIESALEWPADR